MFQDKHGFHLTRCLPGFLTGKQWGETWCLSLSDKYYRACKPIAGILIPPSPRHCSEDDARSLLCSRRCYVDVVIDVMKPPQCKKGDLWTASQNVDVEAWLSSSRNFANLRLESSPGEDYVWRTIMMILFAQWIRSKAHR